MPSTCPSPEPDRSCLSPVEPLFIIIFLSTCRPFKCPLPIRSPHQYSVYTSPFLHTCYMPRSSHSFWFDDLNNIWWEVRSLSFSLCSFLHSLITSSNLGPNTFLRTLFSNNLRLYSFFSVTDQDTHPHKTAGKGIDLCTLIFLYPFSIVTMYFSTIYRVFQEE